MAELEDIIHQPLRLKIMAALTALPASVGLEFSRLKKLTGATDGNLGAHIETLSKAGYVGVDKAFVGKKPQTTVTATAGRRGRAALVSVVIPGRSQASEPGISNWGAVAQDKLEIPDRRCAPSGMTANSSCSEGEIRATDSNPHPSLWLRPCTFFCSVPAAANTLWRGRSRPRLW